MKAFHLAASALILIGLSGPAHAADSTQKTREIVTQVMTGLMINKDLGTIDTYFAAPYVQHNQSVASGIDGLKGLAKAAIADNPDFKYEMIRVLADGNIGITHGIYHGFGPAPLVAFDVFRLSDGKIVEHWDNLSPVAAPNPSGRSQTDGPIDVTDRDKTDANRTLVSDFMEKVLINGAFDQIGTYIDGDNYIQHNSNIADGLSGLSAGLKALADAGLVLKITKLHKIVGEGNFVLALSEGRFGDQHTAFYDLFRVDNGKIAEHWDVISPILPDEKAANTNGKF